MERTRTYWHMTSESRGVGQGLETRTIVSCERIEAGEFECTYETETETADPLHRRPGRQVSREKAKWRMHTGTDSGFPTPEEVKTRLSAWEAATRHSCMRPTHTGPRGHVGPLPKM
ncbi:hypothetical protein pqer_cds_1114 [Pandoravirus quercus]|uniref:Uncharacterized protein n=1 Tax=Pandoravirus quercus TaxID=2107709 RepID=A0A2U7UAT3_9VIRU|nr:hypothetical protein pqer_cds_1114 [Pandoravirus quercus]AVK75536.1 hypothetical protein pqer_cds_1114 [Pandoravirus quercus]